MKINNRLKKIGDLVKENTCCLDVGCDHAMLDIYLTKRGKNIKAIASDIAEGPLNQAKENIKKEHLEKEIETRLGRGLTTYSEGIDTVIISGMGGRSMIEILEESKQILPRIETFILSPNNYQQDLKEYLCKKNFYIEQEELVEDSHFIYQIIVFAKGKKRYTKKEYFFGPMLLQNKGNLFQKYYKREQERLEILYNLLPKNYFLLRYRTKKKIKMIKEETKD